MALLLSASAVGAPGMPAKRKSIAVMDVRFTGGAPDKEVSPLLATLSSIILAEISKGSELAVLGTSDIAAMIGLDKQRRLAGCSEDSGCLAEIGEALGATYVVFGSLGRIGSRYHLMLSLVVPQKARVLARESSFSSANDDALADAAIATVRTLLTKMAEVAGSALPPRQEPRGEPEGPAVRPEEPSTAAAPGPSGAGEKPGRSQEVADLLQKCQKGDERSCVSFPESFWDSEANRQNRDFARTSQERCRRGNPIECFLLAALSPLGGGHEGRETPELFRKSCADNNALACSAVGEMYATGIGERRDLAKAEELYLRGCEGGSASGCEGVGRLRADAGKDSEAVPYFQRACTLGYVQGCTNLGRCFVRGRGGVPPNTEKAIGILEPACARGGAEACSTLATLYSNDPAKDGRTDALYLQGCDGGDPAGCYLLGRRYFNGKGSSDERKRSGINLLQRACDNGSGTACYDLGVVWSEGRWNGKTDFHIATKYYRQSCLTLGFQTACFNLGNHYSEGQGVERDNVRANEYWDTACAAGSGAACYNLARSYAQGLGVKVNRTKALQLLDRACQKGYSAACDR